MLIKKADDIRSSEITPKDLYLNRRKFLAGTAMTGAAAAATGLGLKELLVPSSTVRAGEKIAGIQKSPLSTTEKITPYKDVTHSNNYYDLSPQKDDPGPLPKNFNSRPCSVAI